MGPDKWVAGMTLMEEGAPYFVLTARRDCRWLYRLVDGSLWLSGGIHDGGWHSSVRPATYSDLSREPVEGEPEEGVCVEEGHFLGKRFKWEDQGLGWLFYCENGTHSFDSEYGVSRIAPLSPPSEPAREEPEGDWTCRDCGVTVDGEPEAYSHVCEPCEKCGSLCGGKCVTKCCSKPECECKPAPTPPPALCECGQEIGRSHARDLCSDCYTVHMEGQRDGAEPYDNMLDSGKRWYEPRPRVRTHPLCAPIIWGGPVIE